MKNKSRNPSRNIKRLRKFISNVILEQSGQKLRVFDFDDTLVQTSCKILVIDKNTNEVKREITPAEFGNQQKYPHAKLKNNEEYDYSEFTHILDPKEISWTIDILKKILQSESSDAIILTARGEVAKNNITKFLETIDIFEVPIITLGSADPLDKAKYIYDQMLKGISDIKFFDDSKSNIDAVRNLSIELKLPIGKRNSEFFTSDTNDDYYDILNSNLAPTNVKLYVTRVKFAENC
jgi:hypothetical protein